MPKKQFFYKVLLILLLALPIAWWVLNKPNKSQSFKCESLKSALTGQNETIKRLDLSTESFELFPPYVLGLTELEWLNLDGEIPMYHRQIFQEYIAKGVYQNAADSLVFTKYYYLLKGNQLTKLPSNISNLTQLRSLSINNNQLAQLPLALGKLVLLEELYVAGNQLETIPIELSQLTRLKVLNLAKNQLNKLPNTIGALSALVELDLSYNKLKNLPATFSRLTNLKSLSLQHNQIDSISIQIANLKGLEWLDLTGNNISVQQQAQLKSFLPNTMIVFE